MPTNAWDRHVSIYDSLSSSMSSLARGFYLEERIIQRRSNEIFFGLSSNTRIGLDCTSATSERTNEQLRARLGFTVRMAIGESQSDIHRNRGRSSLTELLVWTMGTVSIIVGEHVSFLAFIFHDDHKNSHQVSAENQYSLPIERERRRRVSWFGDQRRREHLQEHPIREYPQND